MKFNTKMIIWYGIFAIQMFVLAYYAFTGLDWFTIIGGAVIASITYGIGIGAIWHLENKKELKNINVDAEYDKIINQQL